MALEQHLRRLGHRSLSLALALPLGAAGARLLGRGPAGHVAPRKGLTVQPCRGTIDGALLRRARCVVQPLKYQSLGVAPG